MASTLVYFVRHGQTVENILGIIQGQLDTQLDDVGIEQAAAVGQSLKDIKFDIAFSSDLARAVDTASAILMHHPGVPFRKTEILREKFMGNLQGQVFSRKQRQLLADETVETEVALRERILRFWDEAVLPYAKKGSESHDDRPTCILVVSHGAFIHSLARGVVGYRNIVKCAGVEISGCPNASVTLVEVQGDGTGIMRSYGDVSHMVTPAAVENVDDLHAVHRN